MHTEEILRQLSTEKHLRVHNVLEILLYIDFFFFFISGCLVYLNFNTGIAVYRGYSIVQIRLYATLLNQIMEFLQQDCYYNIEILSQALGQIHIP